MAHKPSNRLGISVVIPSFHEPHLRQTLESLAACSRPCCHVEVMVVINYPEDSSQEVMNDARYAKNTVEQVDNQTNNEGFRFIPIMAESLPKKEAGVGLARKIGMDAAAHRFLTLNNAKGIIVCFDADATCQKNFLVEIERFWLLNPTVTGCSIRFEHPLSGTHFENELYVGIAHYELHLRYYLEACRYIGHPHSFHTVGSSMACTAETYLRAGGMNKRKAGEDFYFLQKIIPHGGFAEINATCVYPSPRPSLRVPFGTGRAMSKYLKNPLEPIVSYNFNSWLPIKEFFHRVPLLYQSAVHPREILGELPESLIQFLATNNFSIKIEEIRRNTSSPTTFRKRFFLWFDAFLLLKYLNFCHQEHYSRKPIPDEALNLARHIGLQMPENPTSTELLVAFRQKQCSSRWRPLEAV